MKSSIYELNTHSFNEIFEDIKGKEFKIIKLYDHQYFDFVVFNYLDELKTKELHIIYSNKTDTKNVFKLPKNIKCGIDKNIKNQCKEYDNFKRMKSFINIYGINKLVDRKLLENNERLKECSFILKNYNIDDINIKNSDIIVYPHFICLFVNHEIVKNKFIVNFQHLTHGLVFKDFKYTNYRNESLQVQRYFKFQYGINFCYGNKFDIPLLNSEFNFNIKDIIINKYILIEHNKKPVIGVFVEGMTNKQLTNLKNELKKVNVLLNLYSKKTYETWYLGKCINKDIKYSIDNMIM